MSDWMHKACKEYKGPVKAIDPRYGMFDSVNHCGTCGSTKVRTKRPRGKMSEYVYCSECGRVTERYQDYMRKGIYDIIVEGVVKKRNVPRMELEDALREALSDMDVRYSALKAHQFYGPDYDVLSQTRVLESTFIYVDIAIAVSDGYVDGLHVGEEYNFPDIPVTIVRVEDMPKVSENYRPVKRTPARKSANRAPARRH